MIRPSCAVLVELCVFRMPRRFSGASIFDRLQVADINARGGDWCLSLKANPDSLLSDVRCCFGKLAADAPAARQQETGHGRRETRTATVVSTKGLAEHHDFPDLKAFGRIETPRESVRKLPSETRGFALSWLPAPEVLPTTVRAHWQSRTRCTGNWTSRSARTRRATARITGRTTSRSCAAARWTWPGATRRRARCRSN